MDLPFAENFSKSTACWLLRYFSTPLQYSQFLLLFFIDSELFYLRLPNRVIQPAARNCSMVREEMNEPLVFRKVSFLCKVRLFLLKM